MSVKERLIELSEEKYRKFSSSLIPNIDNVLGVRLPVLRKLAKEIYKSDNWQDFLNQKQSDYMEEVMLQGMIIGLVKDEPQNILNYIKDFVPKINNWAVCDSFCTGLKFTNTNKALVWDFLQMYFQSDKEYELRFGIVMLLSYFIEDFYIDKVLKILDKVNHEGYYVKMAVAWAVSICYIKFSEKTQKYLHVSNLDNWTYNKSIQKIIESYRIDKQTKELLKKMKRVNN